MEINWDAVEAVKTVNVTTIIDAAFPDRLDVCDPTRYEKECEAVRAYCKANNAHYYARDNEYFSKSEARREAYELGKSLVVLDNLS